MVLYQGLALTFLDFDPEKLVGWKGAQFHVSSLWLEGTEPDKRNDVAGLTGSVYSDPSNISGYDTYRLYELWLEQTFLDGKFSARFGQIGVDQEFLCDDYACVFINGAHGWPDFVAVSIPDGGPAYPMAGTGLRLKYAPCDRIKFLAAMMDGDVHNQATDNRYGTHFGFHACEGFLSIFEAAFRLNQGADDKGLPGTYKFGGWYHSGDFDDVRRDTAGRSLEDDGTLSGLSSTGIPRSHTGNGGIYFDASQMLWREREGSDEGIGVYLRLAPWLPDDRNPISFYAAGGVHFQGPLPERPDDVFAVGVSYAQVSDSLRGAQRDANRIASLSGTPNNLAPGPLPDYEMAVEATYQLKLTPWWALQPDFQYIFHPGGSTALHDAVVIGLRTQITF